VGMCGNGWKTENGVLLFIYTSVITVSLATNSSTNNLKLLAITILSPTVALLLPYLRLFRLVICLLLLYFLPLLRSLVLD